MRNSALSQRHLLRGAGGFILASALPFRRSMDAEAVSPVMARLRAYMREARSRALPEPVREKTKHHVLDTVAAMVSGAELPPGRAAIQFARGYDNRNVTLHGVSHSRDGIRQATDTMCGVALRSCRCPTLRVPK